MNIFISSSYLHNGKMENLTPGEMDRIDGNWWMLNCGDADADGNCYICNELITWNDSRFAKYRNSEPYSFENIRPLCKGCRNDLNKHEQKNNIYLFEQNPASNPKLLLKWKKRLVADEKKTRDMKAQELKNKIDFLRQEIMNFESEIKLHKRHYDELCGKFCDHFENNRICAKNDCSHMKNIQSKSLVKINYRYDDFEFERVNSDYSIITRPVKFADHAVSPEYPHRVYFKFIDSVNLTLYNEGNKASLVKIRGFQSATDQEIKELNEQRKLASVAEYDEVSISLLRYYLNRHYVSNINKIYSSKDKHNAFTSAYQELVNNHSPMKTTRKEVRPVNIPAPLREELEKLGLA